MGIFCTTIYPLCTIIDIIFIFTDKSVISRKWEITNISSIIQQFFLQTTGTILQSTRPKKLLQKSSANQSKAME